MSQSIFSTAGFNLPDAEEKDKLRRLLSSALKDRRKPPLISPELSYWNADYFGLQNVKIFQESSQQERLQILQQCSDGLLEEAYFVEKAGVGYMAKMVMLAETTEERMLYALFAADEATHLAQIRPFLSGGELVGTQDRFLQLLAQLVETEDKSILVFLIQVVLEGWGLSHYRSIASGCQNPELAQMFRGFLDAESRHHSAGVTLCDRRSISASSQQAMVEALILFLRMVQVGPQRVVNAIARVKGGLSHQQRVNIFEELETEIHSGTRLQLLRSLMRSANAAAPILAQLEERRAFQPFTPEQCGCI